MRTTVTLDADVEQALRNEIHRTRRSFKHVLNSAVRSALKPSLEKLPKLLPPKSLGLMKGVDPRELSELSDELEAESFLKLAVGSARSKGSK